MGHLEPMDRSEVIDMLGKAIEKCKREIIKIDSNDLIPYRVKTEKIINLRVCMTQTQRALLALLMEEYNELRRGA